MSDETDPEQDSTTFLFTEAQKVDCRRFMGYPPLGNGNTGQQAWRFFQAYGSMEWKLNNCQMEEGTVVATIYLANLPVLEAAIITAAADLNVSQVGPYKPNPNEIQRRTALFNYLRRQLCDFLGLPYGPYLRGNGFGSYIV